MNNKGTLFVVATPIGNLQDVTFRAIETLKNVGVILCEDTRQARKLLERYEISQAHLIPFNEFNEEKMLFKILELLQNADAALISDAGTPLISDPGYKLVREANKQGIRVIPIPGPTALIAALSISGLPTDKFVFIGFLPKTSSKAKKILEDYKSIKTTIVLYESPHRLLKTLELIKEIFGDIEVVTTRELTKLYEEIKSDKISNIEQKYLTSKPKGEFVILFSTKD